MSLRQVSKLQKTVLLVIFYLAIYLLVSHALYPRETITFVSESLRVGDSYALMFLVAPTAPVFSDIEGANVFTSRGCGRCFVTNNKGFLPMSEYDAILVYGRANLSTLGTAFNPEKVYLIEASRRCIEDKLRRCYREPMVTAVSTKSYYQLCELCAMLTKKRTSKE